MWYEFAFLESGTKKIETFWNSNLFNMIDSVILHRELVFISWSIIVLSYKETLQCTDTDYR